ncbi:MAG: Glycosyltransferase involved in cell wall bisynthesis [Verrucomicrobia bacterium]|nr:MAG: Glycosyltransferase involved in cell wall bisynthesis [Verrucomicrobiota bacterium]
MSLSISSAPPASGLSEWVHIPTPGDHYSPGTGSAVITIVAALARVQTEEGAGTPRVLVSKGTQNGYPPYPAGRIQESDFPPRSITALQKLADVILGRVASCRPFTGGLYLELAESLCADFCGVLLVHNQPAAILPLRRRFPKASLVLYAHNEAFGTYSRAETLKIFRAVNLVVCCSGFLARSLWAKVPKEDAHKVKTILNGVDTSSFFPKKQNPRRGDAALNILFVGRMIPPKGACLLLQAAALLHQRRRSANIPPFRVRLVGSSNFNPTDPLTPYERSLRELAAPLGELVEFLPFAKRDKIPSMYQEADIFVAPSNWDEPFGLTVAEAMACGLPCIVARRGGIPEAAGKAALYFTPPHPAQIADHLEYLLTHPKARRVLGARARARALELSWASRFKCLQHEIQQASQTLNTQ